MSVKTRNDFLPTEQRRLRVRKKRMHGMHASRLHLLLTAFIFQNPARPPRHQSTVPFEGRVPPQYLPTLTKGQPLILFFTYYMTSFEDVSLAYYRAEQYVHDIDLTGETSKVREKQQA